MRRDELARQAEPEALVRRVAEQGSPPSEQGPSHGHASPMESVREATYRAHHIVIRTSYRIEVDGQPIEGHLGVSNDGQVHYHAVPNLGFASAVDLVKQLIDTFPDDFDGTDRRADGPAPEHAHGSGRGHDDRQGS